MIKKKKHIVKRFLIFFSIAVLIFAAYCAITFSGTLRQIKAVEKLAETPIPEWVDVQIIGEDCGGRKGIRLSAIRNIVIHYVGNPNTSAQNNRDYFDKKSTKVCSHFIVGLKGEIIQCVPLDEKSVASNFRNSDTISIEVCHPDESGKFNDATYASLIKLTAWLCEQTYLSEDDIIRHYDITGKLCPLFYVENEQEWEKLKNKIGEDIK